MQFSPLSAAQIADSKIPARAILIAAAAILISNPALDRYWPPDSLFPGIGPARGYDWFTFLLTVGVFGLLMRSESMSWRLMRGTRPNGIKPVTFSVAYGALIYMGSISANMVRVVWHSFGGTLHEALSIIGSFEVTVSIDRLASAPIGLWLAGLSAWFIVPVSEEIIFRGLLLRRLLTKTSPRIATILSSVAFALIHIDVALIYPFFAGVLLAILYIKTGSLWLCIIGHGAANVTSFFYRNCVEVTFNDQYSVLGARPTLILFLSFTLLWVGLFAYSLRTMAANNQPTVRSRPVGR